MHGILYKNVNENMGFVLRKSDFVVCEQQRCISGCLYAQSDLHFCYWLSGKDYDFICYIQNFNILVSIAEQACLNIMLSETPKTVFSRQCPYHVMIPTAL